MGDVPVRGGTNRKYMGINGKTGGIYYNEKVDGATQKRYNDSDAWTGNIKSIELVAVPANTAHDIPAHKEVVLIFTDEVPDMEYMFNLYLDSGVTRNMLNALMLAEPGQEITMWVPKANKDFKKVNLKLYKDTSSFKATNFLPNYYKWVEDERVFRADNGETVPKSIDTGVLSKDNINNVFDNTPVNNFWERKIIEVLYPKFNGRQFNPEPNTTMYNEVASGVLKYTTKGATAAGIEAFWPRVATYITTFLFNKEDQYNAMKVFEREYKQAGGTKYCCIDGKMTAAPVVPPPPAPQAVAPVNTPPAVDNDMDDLPF